MLLPLKALFRKKGTISHIFAIALLVAILASVASIINHINLQAEVLGETRTISETFLLMSKDATSITNSEIEFEVANILRDSDATEYILPQKVFTAALMTDSKNYTTLVRGVDPKPYLDYKHAHLNGSAAEDMQANIGEIFARLASISNGDEITLIANNRAVKLNVVGIVRTYTQTDTEIVVPIALASLLDDDNDKVSIIEFTAKGSPDDINHLSHLLPADTKIVAAQQTKAFIQDINNQTLAFLNIWSLAVYATIAAASYTIATRLTLESTYELTMLKALGAQQTFTFNTILVFTLAIALSSAILGLSIGLAGAQALSTITRWMWSSIQVTPFLETGQTIQIIFFTLVSSIIGCTYPALHTMRKTYAEITL